MKKLILCSLFVLLLPLISEAETLDQWLIRLAICESGRRTNIRVLDINGRYSYGLLQFQLKTLQGYARFYGFRGELEKDDEYNPDLQMRVAKAILLNESLGYLHWKNCVKKIGVPPIQNYYALQRNKN